MTKDIRLSIGFLDHPKTIKLQRVVGTDGVLALIRLWSFSAQYKTDGILSGMDADDIEIACKWNGLQGALIQVLIDTRWLDQDGGTYLLHDWKDHQGYVIHSKHRSDRAKRAADAKWKTGEAKGVTRSQRLAEAKKKGNHTEEEWLEMKAFFGTCVKCRGKSNLVNVERDHIIPIYQGGSHGIDNIQPLCAKCNASKGPEIIDWRIIFCKDNGIVMPAKWLPLAGISAVNASGLITPPSPSPSPSPSPIPKDMGKKFIPPTLEEVTAYCQERNNGVDPKRWFNHYTAKGWMIGKNKMKDWRAAVHTWENNQGDSNNGSNQQNPRRSLKPGEPDPFDGLGRDC